MDRQIGLRVIGLLLVAGLALACDKVEETKERAEVEVGFTAAPLVHAVLPLVAVSNGYLYVEGENLTTPKGVFSEVEVKIVGEDSAGAAVEVTLTPTAGKPTRLTLHVPADMHERIAGRGTVSVKTPKGEVSFPSPIFAVEDTGFGGASAPGAGLLGTVYALQPSTRMLPDFSDPCADATVQSNDTYTCPHTMILVPNLNVAQRSFTDGFPGLGDELVEWFAIRFIGFLKIPEDGSYTFSTTSDDGSNLYLTLEGEQQQLVNNDGQHGMSTRASPPVELTAGSYPIVVDYFQGPATEIGIELYWTKPDGTNEIIPAEFFGLFLE